MQKKVIKNAIFCHFVADHSSAGEVPAIYREDQ
jgi:hypothetical protein